MKTNIPIYRAKKIDSDEYIIGFIFERVGKVFMYYIQGGWDYVEIDSSTLAISFDNSETWRSFQEVQSALHLQDSSGCYEEELNDENTK